MAELQGKADHIQKVFQIRRERYAHRDTEGKRVRDILANKLDTSFKNLVPAGQEPVVANIIAAGARLMAQKVGRMPRISSEPLTPRFVTTKEPNQTAENRAEAHEKRLRRYLDRMRLNMTLLQAAYWLVAHDLAPLVVRPSKELSQPVIEVKDPLTCYPGTVWPHKPDVYDVLFCNRMPAYAAVALYPQVSSLIANEKETPQEVMMGEYYDRDGVTMCLLEPKVHVFETIKAPVRGEPMVFLARGFSPDLDFHGQFDSVVPALITQAKVTALAVAYIEQMVYAETYIFGQDPEVISNNGNIAYGPYAVNVVRGQAEKLTNNMSQQVAPLIDRLERDVRMGGIIPSQEVGAEPTSSIATGKGTESLLTGSDANSEYWQEVLGDALERAVNLVPKMAKAMNAPGSEDFADDVITVVGYDFDSSPADVVTKLQLLGPGIISKKDFRRGSKYVDDADETEGQVEIEQLRGVLLQSLAQQVEQGQMGPSDIAEIARLRLQKGEPIEKVIDLVQKQKASQQPQQAPDLASLLQGAPGAGGTPAPPGAGKPGPFEGGQPGVGPAGPPNTQPPVPVPA